MASFKETFAKQVVSELAHKSPPAMVGALDDVLGAFNRDILANGASDTTIDKLGFKPGLPLVIGQSGKGGKVWWHHNPVDGQGKVWNVLPIRPLTSAERLALPSADVLRLAMHSVLLPTLVGTTAVFAAAAYKTGAGAPLVTAGLAALATGGYLRSEYGLESMSYRFRNATAHLRSGVIGLGFPASRSEDDPERPRILGRIDDMRLVKLG